MAPPRPQSEDTSPEIEARQFEILRSMPDWRRLQLWGELNASARALTEAGLRDRYPDAGDEEIRMRLFATWLDRETMVNVYGWDPVEHAARP